MVTQGAFGCPGNSGADPHFETNNGKRSIVHQDCMLKLVGLYARLPDERHQVLLLTTCSFKAHQATAVGCDICPKALVVRAVEADGVYTYIHTHIHPYMYIYICLHLHTYIYIYIYIYTAASQKHWACNRPGRPVCDTACNRMGGGLATNSPCDKPIEDYSTLYAEACDKGL